MVFIIRSPRYRDEGFHAHGRSEFIFMVMLTMVVRFFTVFIDCIELSLLDEPGLIALVVQQAETEDCLRNFLEAVENLK